MTKSDKNPKDQGQEEVHGVQKLVFDYLESLLSDPDAGIDTETEIAVIKQQLAETEEAGKSDQNDENKAGIPAAEEYAAVEPEPEPVPAPVPAQTVAAADSEQASPDVAGREINCVLIRMHGLNLAIPFDYVEGAVHLSSVSLTLDAAHDWCLGRFGGMRSETNVIDTALWLIPERYKPELARYDELIILQGRHWALACDELVKSVRIPADKVSWAGSNNPRKWLWGTYMEERCAILDIPELLKQFDQAF